MHSDLSPAAELRGVTKQFGTVRALDRVNLALAPGQLTALLGPNGAGKTTAVRLMLGTSRPTAGDVRLFGGDPSTRAARQRVGAMLQVGGVPETLTPREHLALFRSYYPDPRPLDEVFSAAGIGDLADRRFGTLSGGQRQRVMFAVALCGNPQLLFLDEPTVGLDVEARQLFWRAIRSLIQEGRSVLLTTHYIEEADALADRVVVLQKGHVVADGSPADVKRLVAGQQVRCITTIAEDDLRRWPHVVSVRSDGSAVVIMTSRAEATVRELLARDPSLSGLEVTGIGLEEAFVAITSERKAQ